MNDPGAPPSPDPRLPLWLEEHLLERRTLMVRGDLDSISAARLAARLMALDGSGDSGVTVHLGGNRCQLEAAFILIDTIDAMGVPVTAICSGELQGPASALLATSHRRLLLPHAAVRLGGDDDPWSAGSPSEAAAGLEHRRRLLERLVERLALATGQPAERVEVDVMEHRLFEAEEAVAYGLADGVLPPPAP